MSFNRYSKYTETVDSPNDYYNSIDPSIIGESIDIIDERGQKIKSQPFEYFFEDIIGDTLEIDFSSKLSKDDYKNIKEDSKECLDICSEFNRISSRVINTWLSGSFKVVDYLVLHIIQNIKKDKPKTYYELGVEKARYKQISEYDSETLYEIGTKLYALYDTRNNNEHRTRDNPDGTQFLIRPNRKKTREMVKNYYPIIMKGFKKEFSAI